MINKENIEIPYPKIMVFRNAIKEPEKIVQELSKYRDWEKWYDIGEQIIFNPMNFLRFEKFPNEEEWKKTYNQNEERLGPKEILDVVNTLEESFFESTEYYSKNYNLKLPNWLHGASNILRYEGRNPKREEIEGKSKVIEAHNTKEGAAGGTKEMTLPFHTDFYQKEEFKPGLKAEYTVTMYLNDDYDGGEIDFRIFNDNENQMRMIDGELKSADPNYGEIPKIIYRPQAGDIIIFPSRVPFYHGVKRVKTGMKYFARMFWMSVLEEEVNQND